MCNQDTVVVAISDGRVRSDCLKFTPPHRLQSDTTAQLLEYVVLPLFDYTPTAVHDEQPFLWLAHHGCGGDMLEIDNNC